MKKGEERKEEILATARRLFYQRGYEKTSVQDILDEMHLSKGGFYHYFESKLQLLEELCRIQMAENGRAMAEAVDACAGDAVAQLNALLARCAPWQAGQKDFYLLVLKVAYRGGSVQLRDSLRQAMLTYARPLILRVIHAGVAQKQFFTRYPDDIGELLLLLFANLTDEIAMQMVDETRRDGMLSSILNLLTAYRSAVETLIGAPYGSIALFELERFPMLLTELAQSN